MSEKTANFLVAIRIAGGIFRQKVASFSSIKELCFHVHESCLTTTSKWREAKYQKLRMPRLPVMEVNPEASHVLSAHVTSSVDDLK